MKARRISLTALLLVAGVVGGFACATDTPTLLRPTVGPSTAPEFSGPWAREYEMAYTEAQSFPDIQWILFDGVITADEMRGVADEMEDCAVAGGAAQAVVSLAGESMVLYPPDATPTDINAIEGEARACEHSTGWSIIATLFADSRSNPDRDDWDTMMADCLAQLGVVPEG